MADKSSRLITDALSRALADPGGMPLLAGKNCPGLFPATARAKQAALLCKAAGYLRLIRTETRGKSSQEICTVSEKGLDYLLAQTHPKTVLDRLVAGLEARKSQLNELIEAARETQTTMESLRTFTERALLEWPPPDLSTGNGTRFPEGETAWRAVLNFLNQWQTARNLEDCDLAELFCRVQSAIPGITVGVFHDALRHLHETKKILLHPWTGPLYDLPEPGLALLIGHEIAYYASTPRAGGRTSCQLSETLSNGP